MKSFRLLSQQVPLSLQIVTQCYFLLSHLPFCHNFFSKRLRKLRKNFLLRQNHSPPLEIATFTKLDPQDFQDKFIKKGQPVLFKEAARHWRTHELWSFDYLIEHFGDQIYKFQHFQGLSGKEQEGEQSLKEYLKDLNESKNYLSFCPLLEINPELTKDLDQNWLKVMRKCFLGISYQTFLGPKSAKTRLHSDTTSFFYIQIRGRKKWTLLAPQSLLLVDPEPSHFEYGHARLNNLDPFWDRINKYEFIMEEGDILYVPSWMWHEVENLEESIGVSYRFTNLRNFFQHPVYLIRRIFFSKKPFLKTIYYSYFKKNLGQRSGHQLTPGVFFDKD